MRNETIDKILEDRDMPVAELVKKYKVSYMSIYSLLVRHNIKPHVHQVHPRREPRRHKELVKECCDFVRPAPIYTNSRSPYGIADELHHSERFNQAKTKLMQKIIPNLMPFQTEPFNGDKFVEEAFLELKNVFSINKIIETGTCLGGSTVWFAQNFPFVATIESNRQYQEIAIERCAFDTGYTNPIYFKLGDSNLCLGEVIREMSADDQTAFFLDAHWGENWPILNELTWILESKLKPIIVIHDFRVPGTDYQFDSYHGQPLDFAYVKKALDLIYGETGYGYHYNSNGISGARVGVIFVYPKKMIA